MTLRQMGSPPRESGEAPKLLAQSEAPKQSTANPHHTASSTATEAQLARLVECLRRRPFNTHELRRLGISHPAGRVQDLQHRGFEIASARVNTVDSDGFTHVNVALYSMLSEPEAGDAVA